MSLRGAKARSLLRPLIDRGAGDKIPTTASPSTLEVHDRRNIFANIMAYGFASH